MPIASEEEICDYAQALAWLSGEAAKVPPAEASQPAHRFVMRVSAHPKEDAFVVGHVFRPAFEVLRRMSGGQIVVDEYWGESAHPAKEGFAALADGRTDLAACYTQWEADAHPMSQLLALPYLFPSSEIGTAVSEALYPRYLRGEFERPGVLMGRLKATGPYHLFSRRKVSRLSDMEGLVVGTNSGVDSHIATELGAQAVVLRSDQLLPAWESGQIDAVSLADGSADVFGIGVRSACRLELGTSMMNLEFGLSESFYNRLPEHLQVVLNDWLRAQAQAETQVFYGVGGAQAREKFAAAGCSFVTLGTEDRETLRNRLDVLTDQLARDLDVQGLPASAFVADARKASVELAGRSADDLMRDALEHPRWLMPGTRPF
ncbi:MAG: TRAP transporter substrate-binding protein DctP [Polaromonas sp.]|nr:TRAP transporter substrate-binding protein DctP [Polaromonas sp.]